ncbi:hypothetical protein [Rhizobium sullae]|uniref:Apea-like HEPN domain-containing protein n=1 Tax=Rhizobium sullae TaxID=50338 RepID=A0A4R3QBP5_RHISU|nr:hypothetical protein [Rhizobium sullae]TCU18781.1 hypothetical protein EV132_1026 [Rhizobium sullae]
MIENVLYDVVPPGAIESNYTIQVYLRPTALTAPALLLKAEGPAYLAAHSLANIREMLRKFVCRQYPVIWRNIKTKDFDGSLFDVVSTDARSAFATALESSSIFRPRIDYTAFPITPLVVEDDFDCDGFSLIDVNSITEGSAEWLLKNHLGDENVGGWLIVKAASVDAAKKDRRAILGALALALDKHHRHEFTLRRVVTGYLRFPRPDTISTSSSGPHTPPLGRPVTVTEADHPWLTQLSEIMSALGKPDRRKIKALEYYYRAWFMDESDRCFLLFMALDAIFGQDGDGFAVGIKKGVKATLTDGVDEKRLDRLLLIRNTMLHGGAPDLFASSQYLEYAKSYEADPSDDIQLLIAKCLRKHIFANCFRPQDDPDVGAIQHAKVQGLIPYETGWPSIVQEWP